MRKLGKGTDIANSFHLRPQLSKFFNLSSELLSIITQDGFFIEANSLWERELGWTLDELRSQHWLNLVHPEDIPHTLTAQVCCQVDSNGCQYAPVEFEHRYRHKDQTYRWLRWRLHTDEQGLIYGVANNVTDLVTTEQALQESEQHLQTIVNNLPVILFALDRYGIFTLAEGQGLDLLGLRSEELLGRDISNVYHAVPQILQDVERALAGESFQNTCQIAELTFEIWYSPTFNNIGEVIGIIGVATNITEKQRINLRLEASEKRYYSVLESIQEVIFQTDEVGLWTFLSPAWEELTGFSIKASLGKNCLNYVHPEDRHVLIAEMRSLLAGEKEDCNCEVRYLKKDNKEECGWFAIRAKLTLDEHGTVIEIAGDLRDVTKRKQTEINLQASEQFLRSIYDGVSDAIFVVDVLKHSEGISPLYEYRFVGWNPADERIVGVSSDEVRGKTPAQIFPHCIAANLCQKYDECIYNGKVISYEEHITTIDAWFLTTLTPLRKSNGEIYRIVGTSTEITAQKQAEAALQKLNEQLEVRIQERTAELEQAKEKFQNLVETTSDCVWEIDERYIFTYISPQVHQILGYAPEQVVGKCLFDFPLEIYDRCLSEVLQPIFSARAPFNCLEVTYLNQKDYLIILENSGVPCFDADGRFKGYRGIARDISDRKRAEAEVHRALSKERELHELKSGFISMVSHEFRTPLSIILMAADALERQSQKLTEDSKIKRLHKIKQSVLAMTDLLEDVLTIGQVEAGKLDFQPESIDLNAFCTELIDEMQLATGNKYKIDFAVLNTLPSSYGVDRAYMDKKLLRHILSNLLSNAMKYSPHHSVIEFQLIYEIAENVFAARHNFDLEVPTLENLDIPVATFLICDRGIGIPPTEQEHLFKTFYRASNVGNISGTGLGLAIIKQSVDLHKGKISFKSELGQGSTFIVTLPLNARDL